MNVNQKKLVSILVPCYNAEKYLDAFFDSIEAQTYRPIEVVVVDDGSTDNTLEKLNQHKKKLDEESMYVKVFHKENGGAASAINIALNNFTGEYVMWMDCDDVLNKDHVKIKAELLNKNPELDFLVSQGVIYNSSKFDIPVSYLKESHNNGETFFEKLIMGHNGIYGSGTILAKSSAINKAIPQKHISESKEGQNIQLILPLTYKSNYKYIDIPLFNYLAHDDSHSHKKRSINQAIARELELLNIFQTTLTKIPHISESDLTWAAKTVSRRYYFKVLITSLRHMRIFKACKFLMEAKKYGYPYGFIMTIINCIKYKTGKMAYDELWAEQAKQ